MQRASLGLNFKILVLRYGTYITKDTKLQLLVRLFEIDQVIEAGLNEMRLESSPSSKTLPSHNS